jgi:RNA polymerase sporulation-specific sigma factor
MGYENNIELIKKAQEGDKKALDKIVEINMSLVGSIVKKFLNRGFEYDDIFQVGCMGLIKAVNKFDVKFDCKFSTYAVPMILGEIKRFVRDTNNLVRVSRSVKVLGRELYFKQLELADKLGREPNNSELSEYTGYTLKEATEAIQATGQHRSFDEIVYRGKDNQDITLGDKMESDFNLEETAIKNLEMQQLMDYIEELPPKERDVIKLRLEDETQVKIAEALGITQVEVSRAEKRAYEKLRKLLRGCSEMSKKEEAFKLFKEGCSNDEVAKKLELTQGSVMNYKSLYNRSIGIESRKKPCGRDAALKLFAKGLEPRQVADMLKIALSTAQSYKNEYNVRKDDTKVNEEDKSKEEVVYCKEIEKPKLLKPKVLEGELLCYEVDGNSFRVLTKDNQVELFTVSKERLGILIGELQELKEVI